MAATYLTDELEAQLVGQRVRVHRNLQNGKWSISQGGRVVAWASSLRLDNVRFLVQHRARERAARERVRNVHAWAEGTFTRAVHQSAGERITYHPFHHLGFVTELGELVHNAQHVHFTFLSQCKGTNLNQLLL